MSSTRRSGVARALLFPLLFAFSFPAGSSLEPLTRNVFRYRDACNVYLIRQGASAILIDPGGG